MPALLSELRFRITEHLPPASMVLLAVSGGADSVALLRGCHALAESLPVRLAVGHYDHGLRPHEAAADAAWVESLCCSLNVPCIVGRGEQRSGATGQAKASEESARNLRYEFLIRTAEECGAAWIATAHTADDQAETVLHHLLRGTGMAGLSGIPRMRRLAENLTLFRPLLDVSRADVEVFLNELRQDYRHDATNDQTDFTRNRIRHELIPLLQRDYNPRVKSALLRLSAQASESAEGMRELADRVLGQAVLEQQPDNCRVRVDLLQDQPRALVREVFVRLWIAQQWPRQRMGHTEWERLAGLVWSGRGMTLPGPIEARRRGNVITLEKRTT